jgi:hypothetical protein
MVSTRMPPPDEVRAHLRKVLASNTLAGSEQLRRLLEVVVERTANGQADTLKEYTIGVEAFGRAAGYDPKIDPIVRVQAGRLRTKLDGVLRRGRRVRHDAHHDAQRRLRSGFRNADSRYGAGPIEPTALILTLGAC